MNGSDERWHLLGLDIASNSFIPLHPPSTRPSQLPDLVDELWDDELWDDVVDEDDYEETDTDESDEDDHVRGREYFLPSSHHHTAHPRQQAFSNDHLLGNLDINAEDNLEFRSGDNFLSPRLHTTQSSQQGFSDDQLLDNLAINADDPDFLEVKIFNCPYCERPKLSISALYDHLILEHLDNELNVCCPICVGFGENHNVAQNVHLSEHIAAKHSASFEQYVRTVRTTNQDDGDRLKFIASTLPPTYYRARARSANQPASSANTAIHQDLEQQNDEDRQCPICWETFSDITSRQLRCQHKFHRDCIQQWINQNNTCPVCRQSAQ